MNRLIFVSFEPCGHRFRAYLSIGALLGESRDPAVLLAQAVRIYEQSLAELREQLARIRILKTARQPMPAIDAWHIGDEIFRLRDALHKESLQLDGLYSHLMRDLGVGRSWLERIIIFRRHLPKEESIPADLGWNACAGRPREVARKLARESTGE